MDGGTFEIMSRRPRGTLGDTIVRVGFIPLLDCAIAVIAAEKGFAHQEGIQLELVRETSWANIRDRVAIGHFDAAQMLAPMPIAAMLGIDHLNVAVIAPMTFGLGGNAITVSRNLWREVESEGATGDGDPLSAGGALKRTVDTRARAGLPPLTFGMVHPFSCHNYELRYWLAASDVDPDRDVRLVVVPPPFMVDALRGGHLDGFCVGDPWNSLAVETGVGAIVTTKAQVWPRGAEKVLGVRTEWAEEHPIRLYALIRAMVAAAAWCDDAGNHAELAGILAQPEYVDCEPEILIRGLTGGIAFPSTAAGPIEEFLVFSRGHATRPRPMHAAWIFGQMVRWGQVPFSDKASAVACGTYRPDLFDEAVGQAHPEVHRNDEAFTLFDGRAFGTTVA